MLAFLLHPLHDRLTAKLKGRHSSSASILTLATPFIVITPLIFIAVAFGRQVVNLVDALRGRSLLPLQELLGRVATYPVIGRAARWLKDSALVSVEQVRGVDRKRCSSSTEIRSGVSSTLALGVAGSVVGFFLMLFMLFLCCAMAVRCWSI